MREGGREADAFVLSKQNTQRYLNEKHKGHHNKQHRPAGRLGRSIGEAEERKSAETGTKSRRTGILPHPAVFLWNVDMVLAKSDMEVASYYSQLVENPEGQAIFHTLEAEWQRTKDLLLQIEGEEQLLAQNNYLRDSLAMRLPYFNALNYLQVELIRRSRQEALSPLASKILHITINGIATGLRNSG